MPDLARQEFSRLARAAWDFPDGRPLGELLDTLNLRRAATLGAQAPKVALLAYTVTPSPQPEDEDHL